MSSDPDKDIKARTKKRYNHVYICLRCKIGEEWKRIKAFDWNENGFNFYIDEPLQDTDVLFKKDLNQFSGNIAWEVCNDGDEAILETLVNNMLFQHLDSFSDNKETMRRIFTLIRTTGHLEEKKKLLSQLGLSMAKEEVEKMLVQYKQEYGRYRYGIQLSCREWSEIVQKTLEATPPNTLIDDDP